MKYFLLAVLIPLALTMNAQKAEEPRNIQKYSKVKWQKKLKIARQKIKDGSYFNAASYLEDAYKEKPTKIDIPHLLGEVNRYMRDYAAAEKYYKEVIAIDPEAYVSDQFYLGQMQKMNGHYDDAKKTFQTYLQAKLSKGDGDFKKLAKIEMDGCDTATELTKNPSKIKVEKTPGINSNLNDIAPKPTKDGIIFSAMKTDTAINMSVSTANYYASIFTSQKTGKNSFGPRKMMPTPPNAAESEKANATNAIISGDEKTMIYTLCVDTTLHGNSLNCKLYRSTKKNDTEWNTPEELKSLNDGENVITTTHPAWGVDAESNPILYFVSDRKGTTGGLDIYYAKMNADGTFGPVTNAGAEVNSLGADMTPFYDNKNKVLYFSSDGHPSIGGLDVFRVQGTPGKWSSKVANAGLPINSPADDFSFALDEKARGGFLVSNRVGTTSLRGATGGDDIWTVTIIRDVFVNATYVKRGDETNTPLQGVDAAIYKVNGNNFDFISSAKTTDKPATFQVERNNSYKINGNKEGFWPSVDNITISEDEEREFINQTYYMDPVIKIQIKIPNVYFAYDKSNVIDFYKGQIDSVVRVLNEHPAYTVEIQGHTDNKGTDEYNEKLSMRRATEVKNFLVKKKKIAENRIVAKWFGEAQPAVPNELPGGEDDPEGRARNRRVEFKIIVDKQEEGVQFENTGEVVKQVKTGPGFSGKKK